MTTLNAALEYLDLEQEDAEKVSSYIKQHGLGLYGVNFHGSVMPYRPEQKNLSEVYKEDPDYYDDFTPEKDMQRGFILGEIDVFFEISEI